MLGILEFPASLRGSKATEAISRNSRFMLGILNFALRILEFLVEILEFPTEFFNLEFLGILDFSLGILEFLEFLD